MFPREQIRNVAIVAHVDHGKTTLVDYMLRQSGVFRAHEVMTERALDSNALEREKGITIFAKNASFVWRDHKINLVDTPGHADFGGEVERALRLVDGVLLLVDAAEGPLPQTRFVLSKALALGLPSVVCINKIDRPDARPEEVLDQVYALYIDLGAGDDQIEFPVLYTVSRAGTATRHLQHEGKDLKPLFEEIIGHIPAPPPGEGEALQLLVDNLDYDDYVGRLAIGRISAGKIGAGSSVAVMREDGSQPVSRIAAVYTFEGLRRVAAEGAVGAGEIVAVAGIEEIAIGDTICDAGSPMALPRIHVDEPTLSMVFRVNDGPFAGRSGGKYVTSRHLRERLYREAYRNVSIRVEETDSADAFKVVARGELQLAVIAETMRREGYEFTVSNPEPVLRRDGETVLEPIERAVMDVPTTAVGAVSERLGRRRGRMVEMAPLGSGRVRLVFTVPARGLIGFRSDFLTETRGEGILSTQFDGYGPWQGDMAGRPGGALVSDREGETVPYALFGLQDRGTMFIGANVKVYTGMIIGEHARPNDLDVNVCREKKLTNIRAAGRDENVILTPPHVLSLEQALEWIEPDELVEVTPESIRLRKRLLDQGARYRAERDRKFAED